MDHRLFWGDPTIAHHAFNEAVIVGQLQHLIFCAYIQAAIANIGNTQPLGISVGHSHERHHRGSHPVERRIGSGTVQNLAVGPLHHLDQLIGTADGRDFGHLFDNDG